LRRKAKSMGRAPAWRTRPNRRQEKEAGSCSASASLGPRPAPLKRSPIRRLLHELISHHLQRVDDIDGGNTGTFGLGNYFPKLELKFCTFHAVWAHRSLLLRLCRGSNS
jgi:hypothetical protein